MKKDGSVWCWGTAGEGLGDEGATTVSPEPVQVTGLSAVRDLAVGRQFACALEADRTVACWGHGSYGQLGDGQSSASPTPVDVALIGNVSEIEAGENHVCALRDGGLVACWGDNAEGQLGDGTTDSRAVPVPVAGLTGAVSLGLGAAHSCAVLAAGGVRCWGDNDDGQLGNGEEGTREPDPIHVAGGLGDAVAVAAGEEHTCALRAAGTVACWGDNFLGQLGDGTVDERLTPEPVPGLSGIGAITAGRSFTCALAESGTRCWGSNEMGQLGAEAGAGQSATPVRIAGLAGATTVAAGASHVCASSPNGAGASHDAVRCWGDGAEGQLGNGKLGSSNAAIQVPGLTGTDSVALGDTHSCTLGQNGDVSCWGSNSEGQLGIGAGPTRPAPVQVAGLGSASRIASGSAFSCAVRAEGGEPARKVSCWGSDSFGQLGVGGAPGSRAYIPVDVDLAAALGSGESRVAALAAGDDFACVLTREDGHDLAETWCWGRSDYGQTGSVLSPPLSTLSPVRVHRPSTPPNVMIPPKADQSSGPTIAAGGDHACVISWGGVGEVWCWGRNFYGQLGDGTTNDATRPRKVPGLEGAVAVYAGRSHTCVLLETGKAKCWGAGSSGQLGNGGNVASSVPVDVLIDGVRSLALGPDQTCAVRQGGDVSCWGSRFDAGFPRAGNPNPQWTPSPLPAGAGVSSVALAGNHACLVTQAETVSCWASGRQNFRFSFDAPHGDGAMPAGHYPIQTSPTPAIGFEPVQPPPPNPGPDPDPVTRRPAHPRIELRDGVLRLRGLPLAKRGVGACAKRVRLTVSGRVAFRKGGRSIARTVRTGKPLNPKPAGSACRVTGAIRLRGRLAKARQVTVRLTGNRVRPHVRPVRARSTVAVRGGRLVLDQLRLGSARTDFCPARATVTVAGVKRTTRKVRFGKQVPTSFAPVAGCQLSTVVRLPPRLSRSGRVMLMVRGPGLKPARRAVKTR